jgi:hypothetical protein
MCLFNTPTLWTQIYIQSEEPEIARVSTFLCLSQKCRLDVEIMTLQFNMDWVTPIAANISRVATISIRPGVLNESAYLFIERRKGEASLVLTALGIFPSDATHTSCFGVSIQRDNQLYYCVFLMRFKMDIAQRRRSKRTWEDYVKRCASAAHCIIQVLF